MNQTSSDLHSHSLPTRDGTVSSGLAVIVGEVLWDCLPGRRVLGGAPLNVAWNLAGFGLDPLFISAVGDDALGHEILETMRSWGLSTEGVRVLPKVPTGTVEVTLVDGEPKYNIVDEVAYDHLMPLSIDLREQIQSRCVEARHQGCRSVLYHGSLALRSKPNRQLVEQMRADWKDALFFDVNIRQPHFDPTWFSTFRGQTDLLKINQDELGTLAQLPTNTLEERQQSATSLMDAMPDLELLLVTLGASGAECYQRGDKTCRRVNAPVPSPMVDAVGAGDAFASMVLHDYLTTKESTLSQQWIHWTIRRAVVHASRVCSLHGATSSSRDFYKKSSEMT